MNSSTQRIGATRAIPALVVPAVPAQPRRQADSEPTPAAKPRSVPAPTDSSRAQRRAAAVRAAMHQPAPAAGDTPPVQVTIGRVEVRAVAAPEAVQRSPRPAPRLSLDQYLRERSGGGR